MVREMVKLSITQPQDGTTHSKVAHAKSVETAAYVKDMTLELAQLTNSAGLTRLTASLILASLEAHLCCSIKITSKDIFKRFFCRRQ